MPLSSLTEILPFNLPDLLQSIADLAEVVTVADLYVESLHVGQQPARVSVHSYVDLGPTTANVLVGILSAIVDNIPVMFAVLTMQPDMSLGQWLLVTLTAGVGGSLLSIGSAAWFDGP